MALVMRLPDEEAAATLWRETGLALVLAHTNPFGADPWRALYDRGGSSWLRPVARDRNDVLFAVAPPGSPP